MRELLEAFLPVVNAVYTTITTAVTWLAVAIWDAPAWVIIVLLSFTVVAYQVYDAIGRWRDRSR